MPGVAPTTILVAGGGIGGLTFARAVQVLLGDDDGTSSVIQVLVLDQRTRESSAGGHGLTLFEGVGVLQRLGLLDKLDNTCSECTSTVLCGRTVSSDGRCVISDLKKDQPHPTIHAGCPSPRSIRRPDLVRLMGESLPNGTVLYNWKVTKVVPEDDCVKVVNQNGDVLSGHILVGFDGIRSVVRDSMIATQRRTPKFGGCCVLVGTAVDLPPAASHQLCPVGSLVHRFDSKTGSVVVYAHAGPNAVAWTIGYRCDEEPDRTNWASQDGMVDKCRRLLQKWRCPPPDMEFLASHSKSCLQLGLYAGGIRSTKSPWSNGRIVLGGDAAHAVLPLLGEGANLAMCDAVVLARHVVRSTLNKGLSYEDAFLQYESERRRPGETAVQMTWWLRPVVLSQNWLVCRLRNLAFRHMNDTGLDRRILGAAELLDRPQKIENPHSSLASNVGMVAAHVIVLCAGLLLGAMWLPTFRTND